MGRCVVLANTVDGDNVDDAVVGAFKAESAPSAHAGGVVDGLVSAAGPTVMGEEESATWLMYRRIADIGAGGVCQFGVLKVTSGEVGESFCEFFVPSGVVFG